MIHKTAEVSIKAKIGKNVKIWALSQVREGVVIGDNCIIGRNVYIDHDVKIGSNVKIQNTEASRDQREKKFRTFENR